MATTGCGTCGAEETTDDGCVRACCVCDNCGTGWDGDLRALPDAEHPDARLVAQPLRHRLHPRRGDPVIPYPTAVLLLALAATYCLAWQSQIADAIDVEAVS